MTTGDADRELRRQRYINHMCIDCGDKRHSAGRPRCDDCHAKYLRFRR